MSLFGQQQNVVERLNSIRLNSSILGSVIPVLFGQHRAAGRLIWYGDFVSAHAKQQGGKGLAKGGTQYVYTASIIAALAHGPLNYLLNVWDTNSRYQLLSASESYTIASASSYQYQTLNASIYANDQGVAAVTPYSVGPFNDYGSPGNVTLTGNQNVPLTPVAGTPSSGQYNVDQTTGVYTFAAADAGKTVSISYSYYRYRLVTEEITIVPFTPGPYTVVVDNSTEFTADDGVTYYPSGTALEKVSGSPAVGQYSQSGATYTFNSGDAGNAIVITYEYTDPNTDTNAPNTLNLTLVSGTQGQSPLSYMTGKHPSQALGYTGLAYIFSSGLFLGYTPQLPNYSFELAGAYQFGAGIVDCDPSVLIEAVLLDPHFGVGFPPALLGSLALISQMWVANSFFISVFLENSESCSSVIARWLEAGMVAGFFSEGLLKFVPYGDSTAVGNGQTYSPPTGPIANITDDQYVPRGGNEDPIKVSRSAWQDVYNRVRIGYAARVNDYNSEVIYEQDDASIATYGLRVEDVQQWDFITTLTAAQYAASMRVQRSCYIRNTYSFSLPDRFAWLEPMDIITVNDAALGLETAPVRIIKIEDDPVKGLDITAEDFLWGAATPAYNPKGTGSPTGGGNPQADPGNTNVVIFEAPDRLGLYGGDILYVFCTGINSNWGGCHVWYSYDGTNYSLYSPLGGINAITQPGRTGTLVSPAALVTDSLERTGGLGANWTVTRGSFSTSATTGATVATVSSGPTDAVAYYSGAAPSSDHWAEVQLSTVPLYPGSSLMPAVRIQSSGDTYYGFLYNPVHLPTDSSFEIFKCVSGTFTTLFTGFGLNLNVGDIIRLEAAGDMITLTINGEIHGIPQRDSSITGGSWGISARSATTNSVVNFAGGLTSLAAYSSANPDTADTALVQLSQNGLTLPSVSSSDAAQGVSLCALANPGTGTIELFSYETSTLEGSGLYALTTLYRGLYNTPAVAHFAGETFARLDEASLTFQYDPSYVGKTISFKFTSFNLFGQMEQSLQDVNPITFELQGVGLGMFSLENGIINSTFYVPPVTALGTVLSGMGLTQSGTSTTIDMASGSFQYGSGTVAYNSASVNPGSYGTWYCYFSDPEYSGGSITLLASSTFSDTFTSAGYVYVGSITTVSAGGGAGGGTGGGTGGGGKGRV